MGILLMSGLFNGAPSATTSKTPTFTNRLIDTKSPYLLQHAHNPVDWYPWGTEALEKAKAENRPIFLSIGYSSCHWCHVMEHESFADPEVAKVINKYYVPIKVDREERPELDHIYMTAVQAMTGSGGWPLTVLLTPDLKPFFGGTYFPPRERWGRKGLISILQSAADAWEKDPDRVRASAGELTTLLTNYVTKTEPTDSEQPALDAALLDKTFAMIKRSFDAKEGGFGDAPKFPVPHRLSWLLRYGQRSGNSDATEMVSRTLRAMAAGGMYDQLGGGFHRYSTDSHWLVPHFEKMLYDQAGLAIAYTEANLVTDELLFEQIAREILDYTLTDLLNEGGGFYSAEDADSEGEEGTFYVWSHEEILAALGPDRGGQFIAHFGIEPGGNWEGKNILYRSEAGLTNRWVAERQTLLALRAKRPRPFLDDKIITGWNGYLIEALAKAGSAFSEPRYLEAASKATDFIRTNLWHDGHLLRYYRGGVGSSMGYAEDYAFLGNGLLALYQATLEPDYLDWARELALILANEFQTESGRIRMTAEQGDELIFTPIDSYDGAMPSSSSAAALFLLQVGRLLGDNSITTAGERIVSSNRTSIASSPTAHVAMLAAVDFAVGPSTEIVITVDRADDAEFGRCLDLLRSRFLPNSLLVVRENRQSKQIESLIPYLSGFNEGTDPLTIYLCHNYACSAPVNSLVDLQKMLDHRLETVKVN
jgi:uncharacterized protein